MSVQRVFFEKAMMVGNGWSADEERRIMGI